MKSWAVAAALMLVCSSQVMSASDELPRSHWAYASVQELAQQGFVLGYPDADFLRDRALTRYEFATIIKRIIDRLYQPGEMEATAPVYLDQVRKLVDEFKVELVVIGADLEGLREGAAPVQTAQADANTQAELGSVQKDIKKLKKTAFSGYIQARYSAFDNDLTEPGEEYPDTFDVRRARIKLTSEPTDRSTVVLQADLGGSSIAARDVYAQYALSPRPDTSYALAGQMKLPFGYEIPQSASRREAPERSLMIERFFPGQRDRGVQLASGGSTRTAWGLGLFNGTGPNTTDFNDAKDLVGTLRWTVGPLQGGISGYLGKGLSDGEGNPLPGGEDADKTRIGFDAQYYFGNFSLKAEYVRGKGIDKSAPGFDLGRTIDGYWAQAGYTFGTSMLVARFDTISVDPLFPSFGRRSAWNLGVLHYLNARNRLKLFYQINEEQFNSIPDNDGYIAEWVSTY